ncbi:MAG: acyltransferase family protein, partial [Schleiferilactobacillus harbinensis]|uniref:acyltransferase n=1 Tax=Schleiferilactobacillus harbinensis TaxID=304207 RepID=UPI0039E85358
EIRHFLIGNFLHFTAGVNTAITPGNFWYTEEEEKINQWVNKLAKHKIIYIDVIRVLSMLGVVLLHVSAYPLRHALGSGSWHLANILTTLTSPSVPLFFMISGAMVLASPHTDDIRYVWRERMLTLFVPFLVWSAIAILVYQRHRGVLTLASFWQTFVSIPTQGAAVALWFMYPLFVLYALSPLLKKLIDAGGNQLLGYALGIWLITNSLLPSIAALLPVPYKNFFLLSNDWRLVGGYLGYFLLGYALYKWQPKLSTSQLALISVALIAVISAATWAVTMHTGVYDERFKGYTTFLMVLLTASLFLLCKSVGEKLPGWLVWLAETLSPLTYGVYLIHNLIVLVITDPLYVKHALPFYLQLPLNFVIAAALSMIVIGICTSIPVIRWVFTGIRKRSAA